MLQVEVAYATAEQQWLLTVEVPKGTSLREAVRLSGIAAQVPGLDVEACPLGIFGKVVSDAAQQSVTEGDRIELYRPLLIDPKEVRKQRADKVARVFKKAKR
ncbi:RnfH family protein [Pseudomonas sp. GD03860]|uniref:RnfH family protein n=1 Tax=Pseudomonas TaxID=286 RepID=UPI002364A64F|nr:MULTISPECIES: RnfH family protein [Pseudomonas]MDD2057277.1 RnfH family protein [Pseudomonas putida]MDH0639730.1 RnfH family protein [Pseudomonas sp. GD03860]